MLLGCSYKQLSCIQAHVSGATSETTLILLFGVHYNYLLTDFLQQTSDDRRIVRCLCGAFLGRCQEHEAGDKKITAYKVLKYAVRPVSPTAECVYFSPISSCI